MKVQLLTDIVPEKIPEPAYPLLVMPKLDGIRCTIRDGRAYSRSGKFFPNRDIASLLNIPELENLDGELVSGYPTSPRCFRETVSVIMSFNASIDAVQLFVFDVVGPGTFTERYNDILQRKLPPYVRVVQAIPVNNLEELLAVEDDFLSQGFEGIVVRSPSGLYKYGRTTVKEMNALKVKRFVDSEAFIIGYEEECSIATGLPNKTLGALIVCNLDGVEFKIGTGFTEEERLFIWSNRSKLLRKSVKYKSFAVGAMDKPRHPVFLGFRDLEY